MSPFGLTKHASSHAVDEARASALPRALACAAATTEVVAAAVVSFVEVYDALAESGKKLVHASADASAELVEHRRVDDRECTPHACSMVVCLRCPLGYERI